MVAIQSDAARPSGADELRIQKVGNSAPDRPLHGRRSTVPLAAARRHLGKTLICPPAVASGAEVRHEIPGALHVRRKSARAGQ